MKNRQRAKGVGGRLTELVLWLMVAAFFALNLTACAVQTSQDDKAAMATAPGYSVIISPTPADFQRKSTVTISGSGFKPKQQLGLRLIMGGVLSDISSAVKPAPVANEYGAFSSAWLLDGEIGAKLLGVTTYTVFVVDEDGKTLATAPLAFREGTKKPAKK